MLVFAVLRSCFFHGIFCEILVCAMILLVFFIGFYVPRLFRLELSRGCSLATPEAATSPRSTEAAASGERGEAAASGDHSPHSPQRGCRCGRRQR